jgi:2-dehydro-3-deoxyphosphogluconate aldolase / (4S)-4-hydroxy-2-oxoglutarate aldolase
MMDVQSLLTEEGIITLAVVEDSDTALPLAEALLAGGVTTVEVALRTEASLLAIRAIAESAPTLRVLAGTVLTKDQALHAVDMGAVALVSPGFSKEISLWSQAHDIPYIPGVATATEIMMALDHGHHVLKFFPAAQLGGLSTVLALEAPFAHRGLSFMMTGGMGHEDLHPALMTPCVSAVSGSWIAPRKDIAAAAWDVITENARAAREVVTRVHTEKEAS